MPNINQNNFPAILAQMYAQARPQFQVQPPRPTVLPFTTGTVSNGMGELGENFGKGLGQAVDEGYVQPRIKAMQETFAYNTSPEQINSRAEALSQSIAALPDQDREKVLQAPIVAKTMDDYQKVNGPGNLPAGWMMNPETGGYMYHKPVESLQLQQARKLESMDPNEYVMGNKDMTQGNLQLAGGLSPAAGAWGDLNPQKTADFSYELGMGKNESETIKDITIQHNDIVGKYALKLYDDRGELTSPGARQQNLTGIVNATRGTLSALQSQPIRPEAKAQAIVSTGVASMNALLNYIDQIKEQPIDVIPDEELQTAVYNALEIYEMGNVRDENGDVLNAFDPSGQMGARLGLAMSYIKEPVEEVSWMQPWQKFKGAIGFPEMQRKFPSLEDYQRAAQGSDE